VSALRTSGNRSRKLANSPITIFSLTFVVPRQQENMPTQTWKAIHMPPQPRDLTRLGSTSINALAENYLSIIEMKQSDLGRQMADPIRV
jgi:hypothetical protein